MDQEELLYRPSHTKGAAEGVGWSTAALEERMAAFQREITGDGDAFGADDLGAVIATIYGAIHQMAFDSYGENAGGLRANADQLQAMGLNQERSEDTPIVEINNVRKMLG